MEETQFELLLSRYNYQILCSLNDVEWAVLTDNWKLEPVKKIILKVAEDNIEQTTPSKIIDLQNNILKIINAAFVRWADDILGGPDIWDHTAELGLQIKAGLLLKTSEETISTIVGINPDYDAIRQIVTDYVEKCQQMEDILSKLRLKAEDDNELIRLSNEEKIAHETEINSKDDIIAKLQEECNRLKETSRQFIHDKNNCECSNHRELLSFIMKLIEQADKEQERQRRDIIYLYLKSVLLPYNVKLPKEIYDSLENITMNKPVDYDKIRIIIQNFNAPIAQQIGYADVINTNDMK